MQEGVRVVGFDCGEEEHAVVLLDGEGEAADGSRVPNRRDRIEEVLGRLLLSIGPSTRLVVVVESKRSYGRVVTDVAQALGCEVWQVNTLALNHFRDVEGQPRKDDPWDAYLAARMVHLRLRGCRIVTEVSEEERALQRLTRSHARLTSDRTQLIHRLRAVLLELAPEMLHRSWPGPKPKSQAMLDLLGRWPGLEGMERAQLRTIEKILRRCRYGERSAEVARQLRDAARGISMSPTERAAVTAELSSITDQIRTCTASARRLAVAIEELTSEHPVAEKLQEMPGIGPFIAATLVSELLPVARTASEAQSATYAGVTPIGRRTGKSGGTARLARGVNSRVLRALYMSSVVAIDQSAIDRAYYRKKLEGYAGHPKPQVAALIALCRQRHKVIHQLMTTDARYDKEVLIARHLDRREAADRDRAA